jgi:hypothetical protein
MLDLIDSREFLFAPLCCDAGVFIRQVKVFHVRVFETRLVTRLSCQPLKEPFEIGEGGVQGRFTQLLTRQHAVLIGESFLESDGLLEMECFEIAPLLIGLEPR